MISGMKFYKCLIQYSICYASKKIHVYLGWRRIRLSKRYFPYNIQMTKSQMRNLQVAHIVYGCILVVLNWK